MSPVTTEYEVLSSNERLEHHIGNDLQDIGGVTLIGRDTYKNQYSQ
jgi:hypothetical protein